MASSLAFGVLVVEMLYRTIDPFPYIARWEINTNQHGNLSQYDEILGWRGVPNRKERFVTVNRKVWIEHNRAGFRDIEHAKTSDKEAIVFLGDSFTWGFEVNFDEMFVNILRKRLPNYEIYNLAQRGYGTDQSLLVFKQWEYEGPLKWVLLLFSENDVTDNNSACCYEKFKPKYELQNGQLVLTNVPVPEDENWQKTGVHEDLSVSLAERLKYLVLQSQFLNDTIFRIESLFNNDSVLDDTNNNVKDDYLLTTEIIKALNVEVTNRGGALIIVAIPSKKQFLRHGHYKPYQMEVERICKELKIDFLDLSPCFKRTFLRTYYRFGMHWTNRGNEVAANAIYHYLARYVGRS